jgi:protein-tyrosine kinase
MTEALMTNDNYRESLIERAAEAYDFGSVFRTPQEPFVPAKAVTLATGPLPVEKASVFAGAQIGTIDRARLREEGFLLPGAPVEVLAEEFRLVKRQLLMRAGGDGSPRDRMVLVCSAQPNEGKTFCSVNLALSLASEHDREVLLVDADVTKPEVMSTLGLSGSAGLIDAIADPQANVEDFIIQTDIPKLSVLPAGRASNDDTERLSSARAAQVIEALAANPRRIVILDSAPVLAASPAAILAHRVGRVLVVVRADRTREADLREAVMLLDGCDDISLLLNGASFFATNRTYGSYYGADA